MKNLTTKAIISLCLILLASCGKKDDRYPMFPDKPSAEAQKGFRWEIVSGAGLKFWAQRDSHTCVVTDALLQGAVVEHRDSTRHSRRQVIKVFPLKDEDIDNVLDLLRETPGWDESQTCKFKKEDCDRKGVTRYVLVPKGDYADKIEAQGKNEAIPSTCNGWGVGNSGTRYFEIYDNHPDKAVFVEIGQEAPLFDPESIVLTDVPVENVKGELVIGSDQQTFVSCNDTTLYWLADKSGKLFQEYDNATQGTRNGYPVYAELQIMNMGKSGVGHAAGYAGVYQVTGVTKVQTVELSPDINHDSRRIEAKGFDRIVTITTADVIYTPTPGENNVEITAPDNLLSYMETFVNRQGTFLLNMKRYPHITSPSPVIIELKAPPVTSIRNAGQGLLILKDGIESDTTLHIAVDGDILCGPISCHALHITSSGNKTLAVNQHIRCGKLTLDMLGNGNIKLEGGLSCDSLQIRTKGGGGILISGLECTHLVASAPYCHVTLSGSCTSSTFNNADKHFLHIEKLQSSRLRINEMVAKTDSTLIP